MSQSDVQQSDDAERCHFTLHHAVAPGAAAHRPVVGRHEGACEVGSIVEFYSGGGSRELHLLGQTAVVEWPRIREMTVRVLRRRGRERAASLFESMPFELRDGTNGFGDEFVVAYFDAPLEQFLDLRELEMQPETRHLFSQVGEALNEVSPYYVRFIAAGLLITDLNAPVAAPELAITSAVVDRALADSEHLIAAGSVVGAVDRVHTAFHGYLKAVCKEASLAVADDASVAEVYKVLREQHPSFAPVGPRATDITKVLRNLASIVDALSPVRNRASVAHPNDELLREAESMLFVNTVRTLLHYIEKRLGRGQT